jgi:hypothetical protein
MANTAIGLVHEREFEPARLLLLSAARLATERKEINAMIADCEAGADADAAWDMFTHDLKILAPIKEMAGQLFEHFMMRSSADKIDQAAQDFLQKLDKWPKSDVRQSLIRMRQLFPAVWKINDAFWGRLFFLTGGRRQSPAESISVTTVVVAAIIVGLILVAVWAFMNRPT